MARDFANTSGSPNIDHVVYSGCPPINSLTTCSIVARVAIDTDAVAFANAFVACQSGDANTGIGFGKRDNNTLAYSYFGSAAAHLQQFAFTCDGTYRSLVLTYDGGAGTKVVAYVNGSSVAVSNQPTATAIGTGNDACRIAGVTGFRFNGRMAEVAVYDRVLTAAEALIHAAGYSTNHFPRGRIFCAPLIREVHDIAGGLTGTITGTTVSTHPRIYA